jgi:Eukaryotic aspartyl protease
MIQRIPVSRPTENPEDLFWADVQEHRHRRLLHQQRQTQDAVTTRTEPQNDNRDTTQSSPIYYTQLPTFNCYDVMYTGTIYIGTPSQEFNVKLDTATSVSWIPSERCDITCRYKWFNKYNPFTSSTYKSIDATLPSEFVEMYPKEYSASVRRTQLSYFFAWYYWY